MWLYDRVHTLKMLSRSLCVSVLEMGISRKLKDVKISVPRKTFTRPIHCNSNTILYTNTQNGSPTAADIGPYEGVLLFTALLTANLTAVGSMPHLPYHI